MAEGNEGDSIVFLALRQIECDIPDSVTTFGAISPDLLVEIVDKCLNLISNGSIKFNVPLPKNVAIRHRICTDIAKKIKSLGFSGDCGYNQLLYPVEVQTRALLTWLVQKLPRTEEEKEEIVGTEALLNKRIKTALQNWKTTSWKLPFCTVGSVDIQHNIYHYKDYVTLLKYASMNGQEIIVKSLERKLPIEGTILENHTLQKIRDGTLNILEDTDILNLELSYNSIGSPREIAASGSKSSFNKISTLDTTSLYGKSLSEIIQAIKASGPVISKDYSESSILNTITTQLKIDNIEQPILTGGTKFDPVNSSESILVTTSSTMNQSNNEVKIPSSSSPSLSASSQNIIELEREVDKLKSEVINLAKQCVALGETNDEQVETITKLEQESEELKKEAEKLENTILVKKEILKMLPEAKTYLQELRTACTEASARLSQLHEEWDNHKKPYEEQLRNHQHIKHSRRARCKAMVEEIKRYKEEMNGMSAEVKEKQIKVQALEDEKNRIANGIHRAVYTQRILDISSSVDRQNKEIERICADILGVQRSISQTTSVLQRADAVAEELIYNAANGKTAVGDKSLVAVYKQLKDLRTYFDALVATVDKIGQLDKQNFDLETRIDQEKNWLSSQTMEQLLTDLQAIQAENVDLINEIKSLKTQS